MEKLVIDKEWLVDNGFTEVLDRYVIAVDNATVTYNLKENRVIIDNIGKEEERMHYIGKCISTEKLKKILEVFEIPYGSKQDIQ